MYYLCWLTKTCARRYDIIAEDVAVTPAFVDSHCHIGMARLEETQYEGESSKHMDPVLPTINSLYSIYENDTSFGGYVKKYFMFYNFPSSESITNGKTL